MQLAGKQNVVMGWLSSIGEKGECFKIHLTNDHLLGAKYYTRSFGGGGKMCKVRYPPEGSMGISQKDPLQFLQPKVLGLSPSP